VVESAYCVKSGVELLSIVLSHYIHLCWRRLCDSGCPVFFCLSAE